MRCDCPQRAVLRHTGKSPDETQYRCPVCHQEYYQNKEGKITKERLATWPTTKKKFGVIKDLDPRRKNP
jgi:hypothetical protein